MTFSYNNGVPATNNDPSVDQPDMLLNAQAISGIADVDHIGFNSANGGMHRQSTYPAVTTQGAQSGLAGVGYTIAGTANTGASQWSFKNSISNFVPTTMRAWGFCNSSGIVSSQSMNVATFVRNSAGNYTITLTTNVVAGTNFGVLVSNTFSSVGSSALIPLYSITGAGTFTLKFSSPTNSAILLDPVSFTFQILQI